MTKTNLLLSAAVAGMLSAGFATTASATDAAPAAEMEKCYGIAAAGKNDCASADGAHSCAGQATTDNSPNEFVNVAKGECEGKGGKLTPEAK